MPFEGNRKSADVNREDLEGPAVDRRTMMKLMGPLAAGAVAGCTGEDGGGGGDGAGGGDGGGGDGSDGDDMDGGDGGGDGADNGGGGDRHGGIAKAVWNHDRLESLDPHYQNDGDEFQLTVNVLGALVQLNPDGELVGELATDWSIPDKTTYVFNLRDDVMWHNGDEFKPEDVVTSFDILQSRDDSPHQSKISTLDTVEVTGNNEVTFNLSSPTAPFMAFLTNGPGRAGVIVHRSARENPDEYNQQPIGTGPFRISDRRVGEWIELERFEDYYLTDEDDNQLPYLDGVRIDLVPEPSTQWTAVKTGDAHLINKTSGDIWQQAKDYGETYTRNAWPGDFATIDFVCRKPHEWKEMASYASGNPVEEITTKWEDQELQTTDPKVRKAVTLAIDRTELVEKAWFGAATEAHQFYNPIMGFLYDEEGPPEERGQYYDPERAKELLDEAGYTGDPRMEVSFLGENADKRPMTVMQQQLSRVGIEAELVIKSPSAVDEERYEYIHQFFRYGGSTDTDPFMSHWKQRGSPDPSRDYVEEYGLGSWSKGLYANKDFDMKLIESFETPQADQRREQLYEAQRIHETVDQEVSHPDDNVGPSTAMTTFPADVKVARNELKGIDFPAGLPRFHAAHLPE